MHEVLKRIVASATDARSLVSRLGEEGLESVKGTWNQLPIVSSLRAMAVEELERDETHYFVVPQPGGQKPALYTRRVLPSGVGAMNSLPKARLFHLPDSSVASLAKALLVEAETAKLLQENPSGEAGMEALDRFGESIDSASEALTGGLLLLGGAVIWVNPLAGAGIAIAGWAAQLGAKLATGQLTALGEKISTAQRERERKKSAKLASREVRRLRPEIQENSILRALDAVFTEACTDAPPERYDPALDRELWPDSFPSAALYQLSVEAVQASLPSTNWSKASDLTRAQRQWLKELTERDFSES